MAISMNGLDKLQSSFDRYTENYRNMAMKALKEAIPIGEQGMKNAMNAAIANHDAVEHLSLGDMVASVEASEIKENNLGYYTVIRATGRNRHGTRNAEVAGMLEYGTSKMNPSTWREASASGIESKVVKTMQDVIDEEIAKWFK